MRRQKKRNKKNSETSTSDSEASSAAASEEDRKSAPDAEKESSPPKGGKGDGWSFEADDIDINKMIDEVVGGGCPVSQLFTPCTPLSWLANSK